MRDEKDGYLVNQINYINFGVELGKMLQLQGFYFLFYVNESDIFVWMFFIF